MNQADGNPPEPWPYRKSDRHGWPSDKDVHPDLPNEPRGDQSATSYRKDSFAALLDVRKKRTDEEIQKAKAINDAHRTIEQEYYKAVLDVAKGGIERTRSSAETVQKAGAAIVTLYTGVLALAFSATNQPLPGKALYAVLLLGAATVLSTAYLAYLPDFEQPSRNEEEPSGASLPELLTNTFIYWTRGSGGERRRWLRGSVIALGAAVFFMPAPFVQLGGVAQPAEEEITAVTWPTPDPAAGESAELKQILYQAQVDQAAAEMKTPVAGNEKWWWMWPVAFVLALVLILYGSDWYPRALRQRIKSRGSRPATDSEGA